MSACAQSVDVVGVLEWIIVIVALLVALKWILAKF